MTRSGSARTARRASAAAQAMSPTNSALGVLRARLGCQVLGTLSAQTVQQDLARFLQDNAGNDDVDDDDGWNDFLKFVNEVCSWSLFLEICHEVVS